MKAPRPGGGGPLIRRAARAALLLGLALLAIASGYVAWRHHVADEPATPLAAPVPPPDAAAVARGGYLALAGNCAGCHTARGGESYAGGRGIATPFGTVYASNLTPDADTGIGGWSPSEFRRALRHGRSRDGRLLAPAFPYIAFNRISDEDADAIHAYLRSLPPVRQAPRPHELRFPYGTRLALAVWRALFFKPGALPAETGRSANWRRGRYLVEALGHCSSCHSPLDAWGAVAAGRRWQGGTMPGQAWYAPSLLDAREAGVQAWPREDIVALLQTGRAPRGTVMGPMAEVVFTSTQHLSTADLRAVAEYLQSLPEANIASSTSAASAGTDDALRALGAQVYDDHCARCHGANGEGVPGLYGALAGNRAVLMPRPDNLILAIRHGGFLPATAGNPRPFGMPPFAHLLDDAQVAAVATHLRQAWSAKAAPVSRLDVWRVVEGGAR